MHPVYGSSACCTSHLGKASTWRLAPGTLQLRKLTQQTTSMASKSTRRVCLMIHSYTSRTALSFPEEENGKLIKTKINCRSIVDYKKKQFVKVITKSINESWTHVLNNGPKSWKRTGLLKGNWIFFFNRVQCCCKNICDYKKNTWFCEFVLQLCTHSIYFCFLMF